MEHDVILRRGSVTLRPLAADDARALRAAVDEAMWAGMSVPLPATDDAMAVHLQGIVDAPGTLAFAVELDGELVGRTTFYDLVPGLRVEIGNTIYARRVWGSALNPTTKLLMLGHAFDGLAVHRVALRCDSRNARSHRAIARLGATYEGTLRSFRRGADGSIVDVDYFAVVRGEWPAVRDGLLERAAPA